MKKLICLNTRCLYLFWRKHWEAGRRCPMCNGEVADRGPVIYDKVRSAKTGRYGLSKESKEGA